MPATRRTRAQTAKASKVSLDTILLATAIGAGAAAYFFLDVAPEVVAASCVAALTVILIYGGKVQKYVRGRKPKAAKKAAPKSPKPTRVQPKRSATPEPLSRKPSSPKPKAKPSAKKAVAKPAASPKPKRAAAASPKKPAVKAAPAKKPASKPKAPAKKPARKAAVSPKKPAARGGSRATLEALASARSTPATRAELKTTLETLGVDFKSSDSTKYLQRKLENWLEEN